MYTHNMLLRLLVLFTGAAAIFGTLIWDNVAMFIEIARLRELLRGTAVHSRTISGPLKIEVETTISAQNEKGRPLKFKVETITTIP